MDLGIELAWDAVLAVGALLVVVTGALALAPALRGWWRRTTIGRRRDHYRRLSRLGTNAQLAFFNSVLGQPPAYRRTFTAAVTTLASDPHGADAYVTRIALFAREFADLGIADDSEPEGDGAPRAADEADFDLVQLPVQMSEVIWVDRDYYVQALVDSDESVLAFAVTTRHRRFRPRYEGPSPPSWLDRTRFLHSFRRGSHAGFRQPLLRVKLLKTRFAEFDRPRAVYANLGLRRFNYAEAHWYGNPGAYQHFVLAWNDSGASSGWPDPSLIFGEGIGVFRSGAWAAETHHLSADEVLKFRRQSSFNTYAVVGPRFHIEDFPVSFGPDLDEVRTIE